MAKKEFMNPITQSRNPIGVNPDCGPTYYGSGPLTGNTSANNSPTGAAGNSTANQTDNETARLARSRYVPDQSSAETARLNRSGTPEYQSAAETERLKRHVNTAKILPPNQSAAETARLNRSGIPDNPMAHQTDNICANTNIEPQTLNFNFQPNALDAFDVVTYHWKLFITDPDTASTGKVLQQDKQIIIAESGVTEMTIDNVEIRGITTPSTEGGTGTMTNVKFDITEPGGAGLVDKLFYQSAALGIGSWTVMPVYLQLQFRARDPVTSEPINGAAGSVTSVKWLWALKITNIKATVTHMGTKYEFVAIIFNEFAHGNAASSILSNISLSDLSNFGSAMEQLQDKINLDQSYKTISSYSIPDTYRIIVDPDLAIYTITPPDNNKNSQRHGDFVKFENKDATFSPGTSIDRIIDTLLSQTKEAQKAIVGSDVAGKPGEDMNKEPSQMRKLWRIIPETRPMKFDPLRQDNAKEITYFVVRYDIGILDSNAFQTTAGPKTIQSEKKRLATYIQKSVLRKKYNYIFTGLNDQIIKFDLVINNAFASSVARLGGIYVNPAAPDMGAVAQRNSENERKATELTIKAVSLLNNPKTANSKEAEQARTDATNAIAAAKLDPATESRYTQLLNTAKSPNRLEINQKAQQTGDIGNATTLEGARLNATVLARPKTDTTTQKQYRFLADVDVASKETQDAYADFMKYAKSKMRPVARVETMQDKQNGPGVENNSDSGIQKLSSMFAVALHSGLDASFQRIKMTIKGDPFWLFPQPILNDTDRIFLSQKESLSEAIEWIKRAHFIATESVNFFGTDNFILIRFRTPKIYDHSDPVQNNTEALVDVQTFSGVYKVVSVTNHFNNGVFQQELDCILDPEISIFSISDQVEQDARKKDNFDITFTHTNIPATAKQIPIASEVKVPSPKIDTTSRSAIDEVKSRLPANFDSTSRSAVDEVRSRIR